MKSPKESNIVVCSIVRNAEGGLRRNIPVIQEVLSHFKDYKVFVYENDSVDATKLLLQQWTKDDSQVIACMNDTDKSATIPAGKTVPGVNPFFCHKRIDKMAGIRNHYMEWLDNLDYDPDYVIVVDLDVSRLNADAILTSFGNGVPEWDAVTAFGYSTSPKMFKRRYHDSFALTVWEDKDVPQTEAMIVNNAFKYGNLKANDQWVRVASAFGGLSIYRFEAIKGLRYTEPAIDNNDSRVEVRCEHFSLYRQMIERGFDKIYINPAMKLKYQDLTFKTFWNSLHESTFLGYYKRRIISFFCGNK